MYIKENSYNIHLSPRLFGTEGEFDHLSLADDGIKAPKSPPARLFFALYNWYLVCKVRILDPH